MRVIKPAQLAKTSFLTFVVYKSLQLNNTSATINIYNLMYQTTVTMSACVYILFQAETPKYILEENNISISFVSTA